MKAKEYYEKYKDRLLNTSHEAFGKVMADLFTDMINEILTLAEARGHKTNKAMISLAKEQNQKHNSIVNMVNTSLGYEYLRRNGFQDYCNKEIFYGREGVKTDEIKTL